MAQEIPDFIHFLYFAPGIGARWFLEAAQPYWVQFQPLVTYDLALVAYVPSSTNVVITSVARTDTADVVRQQIEDQFPNAEHDALVYDYIEYVALTLDARVEQNQPFGRAQGTP